MLADLTSYHSFVFGMKRFNGKERWFQTSWGLCGTLHSVGSCVCLQGWVGRKHPPAAFLLPSSYPSVYSGSLLSSIIQKWASSIPTSLSTLYPIPSLLPWFFQLSKLRILVCCLAESPCDDLARVLKSQNHKLFSLVWSISFSLLLVCTEIKMLLFSG